MITVEEMDQEIQRNKRSNSSLYCVEAIRRLVGEVEKLSPQAAMDLVRAMTTLQNIQRDALKKLEADHAAEARR